MYTPRILLLVCLSLGAYAAEDPATGGGAAASAALEGRVWRLAAYRSGDRLRPVEPQERPARLRLEGGRLSGNAGCNAFTGAYTLDGPGLTVDPRIATTMMACPEPLMAQERAVTAHLAAVAGYRLDGLRLDLLDDAGATLLTLEQLPETPLVGVTWRLQAYNNGRGGLVSVLSDTEVTLVLNPDGTLGGSDGCNRYMSGYTLEEDRLAIGPIATTRMACRGPESLAEQAAAYAAVLGRVRGYRIEGGELWLTSEDGTVAARYLAAPE